MRNFGCASWLRSSFASSTALFVILAIGRNLQFTVAPEPKIRCEPGGLVQGRPTFQIGW